MKLSHREFLSVLFGAGAAATLSCASKPAAVTIAIGEKVQVGRLVYQVIDAQWLAELEGAKQPVKNRVLQLRVTITNGGGSEAAIPFLRLVDKAGQEIMEIAEIEGNNRWLGMLRRLQPALTEEGSIFFDVPVGAYKLEVVDNSDADNERIAYVEIPASLAPPPVTTGPGGV
ncbi:MAG: DUF4352 domain-containing protein [Bryobacterales bacterium]|nr:DUF4352 domain-containing protein [Bryobacterales bacterium]